MKKVLLIALSILIAIGFFTACTKSSGEAYLDLGSNYFEYPQEVVFGFDVDEKGILYYLALEERDEVITYLENNEEKEIIIYDNILYAIDSSGNLLNTFLLGEVAVGNNLVVNQGSAYFTSNEVSEHDGKLAEAISLYRFEPESQSTRQIYQFTDFKSIDAIEVINDKIYYMGINKNYVNKEYSLADDDTYLYAGEAMGVIDINSGEMVEIPVDFPVAFSKTLDNDLMIYAHDEEEGYYFIEYNTTDMSPSQEKTYHDLGRLFEFDIYNKKNDFVFSSADIINFRLSTSSINDGSGISEVMPDVYLFGTMGITCEGGYTFYHNQKTNRIERIKNSSYIRGGKTIRMINTQYFENDPFGCGYTIERERTDEESFALAVLSQDDSFDLCLMDSRQDISANIRDKGSFYALNEVEGVSEYMDACFPYIKDIATTEDGDIWMLPLEVDVPCLLYNEPLCSEQGIDLSIPMNLEAFVSLIRKLNGDEEFKDRYGISGYVLRENIFCQYLRAYEDFDNDYFKELALFFKENLNYEKDTAKWITNGVAENQLARGKGDNVLFAYEYYYRDQSRFGERNSGFRAGELPHITEDKSNIATCLYLCVNPASKNLKETIRYISSLCVYLTEHNDTMLFSDRLLYPDAPIYNDLYKIYKNADIQFTLPGDIFISDFHAYLRDEIDLDTLAREAQRKVNAYRKE